jgi:hypothetical protein
MPTFGSFRIRFGAKFVGCLHLDGHSWIQGRELSTRQEERTGSSKGQKRLRILICLSGMDSQIGSHDMTFERTQYVREVCVQPCLRDSYS